jgi:hypothetical protein
MLKMKKKKLECFEVNLFLGKVKKRKGEESGGEGRDCQMGRKVIKTRGNDWFNEVIINIINQLQLWHDRWI